MTVPNVTFKFTITAGDAVAETATTPAISKGIVPEGGLTIPDAVFGAVAEGEEATTDSFDAQEISKDVTIDFKDVNFTTPGIYRYVIKEEKTGSGDGDAKLDNTVAGITNDTTAERYLDVYVGYITAGEATESLGIEYCVLHDTADAPTLSTTEGNPTQTATYTEKSEGFENKYDVYDLTLTKKVTGNQGDKTKGFTFTVTITEAEGATITTTTTGEGASVVPTEGKSGEYTVTLKDGQSATFKNLPKNAKYVITETNADGYTITAEGVGDTDHDETAAAGTYQDNDITADTTVTFTNDKGGLIPTGVLLSVAAPAVLGAAVAGGIITLVVKKKKRAEEE